MSSWPAVDRETRHRLLDEVRRRHNVEAGQLEPSQRLERLDQLVALARGLVQSGAVPRRASGQDEPMDLLRRMKARFRQTGERG